MEELQKWRRINAITVHILKKWHNLEAKVRNWITDHRHNRISVHKSDHF
jgi:hypothetical protein